MLGTGLLGKLNYVKLEPYIFTYDSRLKRESHCSGRFFDVKRVYWIDAVPGGTSRGAHAHKKLKQLIIAISGSFEIELDDGKRKETFTLNRSNKALLINPCTWRDIKEFSSGGILLCLASQEYDQADYIHNYNEFVKVVGKK